MIDSNIPDDIFPAPGTFSLPDDIAAQMDAIGLDKSILLPDGTIKPVKFSEWAVWLENDPMGRQVMRTDVRGAVGVSTIFLGLDHSWGVGPPLWFETMVFGGLKFHHDQYRWSTLDEARAGHMEVCAQVDAYYSRWWIRVGEPIVEWTMAAWHHTIEENEWDWSTRQWTMNEGAHEARDHRRHREWEWSLKQSESVLAADESKG